MRTRLARCQPRRVPDSTVHNHPPASPNPTPKQALRVALAVLSWLVLAAKTLGFWVMVPLPLQLAIGLVLCMAILAYLGG